MLSHYATRVISRVSALSKIVPATTRAQRRLLYWTAGIFVLALSVRLALILMLGTLYVVERTEVVNVAIALAQRGEFADAYGSGTGATAHTGPVYPILLSLLFRGFGVGTLGCFAQEALSSSLAAAQYACLPMFALFCRFPWKVGVIAGLIGAVLPINFWSETKGSFEAALVGLLTIVLTMWLLRTWARRTFTLREVVAGGVISGVAALSSTPLAVYFCACLVASHLVFHSQWRQVWRFYCVILVLTIAFVAPWAVRNLLVMGEAIWTRSNLGLELYISNNDEAGPLYSQNVRSRLFSRFHPHANRVVRQELMNRGEVQFHRKRMDEALAWMEAHPGPFLRLTAARVLLFWFPAMRRPSQTALIHLITAIALLYFAYWAGWCRSVHAVPVLLLFATYPAVYYLVQVFPRYRYPVESTLLLLSTEACFEVVRKLHHRSMTSQTPALTRRPRSLPDQA
jgi:hypothetical protein